jgi:SIT4 phosphatase-associated protein
LIDHLEFKAIAECLVRVISLEQATVTALDNFIDVRLKALTRIAQIFEIFEEGGDLERVSNASFVLCELVNKRPNLNCGAQIEEHFNSKVFLDLIYNNALRVEPLSPHVLNVICVLVQLNLLNKNIAKPQSNSDEVPEDIVISDPENELHVQYLADNLSKFAAYLDMDTNRVLSVSYGNPTMPLGTARLRIVDIVANAAKLNNTRINQEICGNFMFSQFMTLVTKFEWNNILHNIIEKLFTSLIEGPPGTLRHHVFFKYLDKL